jgi:hypothetical protein
MDVVTVFLNPDVEEQIYIQFPQGLEVPEEFKKEAPALRVLKGLYGLKQAPRLWNYAKLLQLFISRKIAFQREKIDLRSTLKDIRASLDL